MRTRGTSENEELMLCPWHSLTSFPPLSWGLLMWWYVGAEVAQENWGMDASDGNLKCQCPHPLCLGGWFWERFPWLLGRPLGNLAALTPSVTCSRVDQALLWKETCSTWKTPFTLIVLLPCCLPSVIACTDIYNLLQSLMIVCLGMCFISFRSLGLLRPVILETRSPFPYFVHSASPSTLPVPFLEDTAWRRSSSLLLSHVYL